MLFLKLNVNIIATSHHMHLETSSSFWKNSKFKMHLLSGLYLAWDFSDIFSAEINKHDLDKHMHKEINRINVWECYIFELYEQKSLCHYFPFYRNYSNTTPSSLNQWMSLSNSLHFAHVCIFKMNVRCRLPFDLHHPFLHVFKLLCPFWIF